jgi:SAM-dependent methyltransferase
MSVRSRRYYLIVKILDLGCGNKRRPGTIGVDFSDRFQPDVIHDLNVFPYPFESNSIDKIYLDNVLEHLDNPLRVMEELFRITKDGAEVVVIVPYFRSRWAAIDMTHKTLFTVDSFAYFDPTNEICKRYDYTDARFKIKKRIFNEEVKSNFLKQFLVKLANRFPNSYENILSHLVPLDDITFYLSRV